MALLAAATAPARDVEWDGYDVALLDELDVATDLDHLARDLVAQDQTRGGGRPAAHHVLVRAADVGRDDSKDDPVGELAPDVGRVNTWTVTKLERREIDPLNFDLARLDVRHASIVCHGLLLPYPVFI